jgi:hypothetical protein
MRLTYRHRVEIRHVELRVELRIQIPLDERTALPNRFVYKTLLKVARPEMSTNDILNGKGD